MKPARRMRHVGFARGGVAGTLFRGYETIIADRDARDVMALSSRSCGWCGGVHQTTASMACEMAWGLRRPPPMGLALRTVAQATEAIWVHAAHLAVRAGPDYCAGVIETTTPWVWKEAVRTEAPGAAVHGYATIAELMEALTPATGDYWFNTMPAGRRVLEMINLLYGRYPHPSVLSPGGSARPSRSATSPSTTRGCTGRSTTSSRSSPSGTTSSASCTRWTTAAGRPGPLEEGLIGSPILEQPVDGRLRGVDVMRVIHSFDPCMSCGVH